MADAMDAATASISPDGDLDAPHGIDGMRGRRTHIGNVAGNFTGGARGLGRQLLHLIGHHREPFPGVPGSGGFDGGVQCQQVGLGGNASNEIRHRTDPADGLVQRIDRIAGLMTHSYRLSGHHGRP